MKKALLFFTLMIVGFSSFAQSSATTNAVTNITPTSVTLNGFVDNQSGDVASAKFAWGLNPSGPYSAVYAQDVADGSTATVSVNLTGLTPGTTYKFRVRLFDIDDVPFVSGSYLTFTTSAVTAPTVTIGAAFTSITSNSANNTTNNATSDGGSPITDKGMVYGTSTNPDLSNSVFSTGTSGTGTYNSSLTGLNAGTTYYARAYATNAVGTSYSTSEYSFTTLASQPNTQATINSITSASYGSLTINYTAGSGSSRLIYIRETNQVTNNPSNGVSNYSANTVFGAGSDLGNGTYVVFNGGGAKGSLTVTGLDSTKDYYVRVAEYSGSGTTTNYNLLDNQLGTDGTTFPVVLVSFTGKNTAEGINLNWSTASEFNNNYFILEKSMDGSEFNQIGKVEGAGNSNLMTHYEFNDNNLAEKYAYYRLRQVDFDGRFTLSKTIMVNKNESDFEISRIVTYSKSASMFISNKSKEDGIIEVMDASGKLIFVSHQVNHNQEVIVPLTTKGLYFVRVIVGTETLSQKFVF